MKLRLEVTVGSGRDHVLSVEAKLIPRRGDKVQALDGVYEVLDVLHTSLIREWDAVVLVSRQKLEGGIGEQTTSLRHAMRLTGKRDLDYRTLAYSWPIMMRIRSTAARQTRVPYAS